MNPIDYLESLIAGHQNSSIPVQLSELKTLLVFMKAQRVGEAPAPAATLLESPAQPDAALTEKHLRERAHRAWVDSTIETMDPERVFVRGYLAAHAEEGLDPFAEPGPWFQWNGDYEKQAYDVWVSGCDVVFGCWPGSGRMCAVDGSGREWAPDQVLAVRVSAYQGRYPRPFKRSGASA